MSSHKIKETEGSSHCGSCVVQDPFPDECFLTTRKGVEGTDKALKQHSTSGIIPTGRQLPRTPLKPYNYQDNQRECLSPKPAKSLGSEGFTGTSLTIPEAVMFLKMPGGKLVELPSPAMLSVNCIPSGQELRKSPVSKEHTSPVISEPSMSNNKPLEDEIVLTVSPGFPSANYIPSGRQIPRTPNVCEKKVEQREEVEICMNPSEKLKVKNKKPEHTLPTLRVVGLKENTKRKILPVGYDEARKKILLGENGPVKLAQRDWPAQDKAKKTELPVEHERIKLTQRDWLVSQTPVMSDSSSDAGTLSSIDVISPPSGFRNDSLYSITRSESEMGSTQHSLPRSESTSAASLTDVIDSDTWKDNLKEILGITTEDHEKEGNSQDIPDLAIDDNARESNLNDIPNANTGEWKLKAIPVKGILSNASLDEDFSVPIFPACDNRENEYDTEQTIDSAGAKCVPEGNYLSNDVHFKSALCVEDPTSGKEKLDARNDKEVKVPKLVYEKQEKVSTYCDDYECDGACVSSRERAGRSKEEGEKIPSLVFDSAVCLEDGISLRTCLELKEGNLSKNKGKVSVKVKKNSGDNIGKLLVNKNRGKVIEKVIKNTGGTIEKVKNGGKVIEKLNKNTGEVIERVNKNSGKFTEKADKNIGEVTKKVNNKGGKVTEKVPMITDTLGSDTDAEIPTETDTRDFQEKIGKLRYENGDAKESSNVPVKEKIRVHESQEKVKCLALGFDPHDEDGDRILKVVRQECSKKEGESTQTYLDMCMAVREEVECRMVDSLEIFSSKKTAVRARGGKNESKRSQRKEEGLQEGKHNNKRRQDNKDGPEGRERGGENDSKRRQEKKEGLEGTERGGKNDKERRQEKEQVQEGIFTDREMSYISSHDVTPIIKNTKYRANVENEVTANIVEPGPFVLSIDEPWGISPIKKLTSKSGRIVSWNLLENERISEQDAVQVETRKQYKMHTESRKRRVLKGKEQVTKGEIKVSEEVIIKKGKDSEEGEMMIINCLSPTGKEKEKITKEREVKEKERIKTAELEDSEKMVTANLMLSQGKGENILSEEREIKIKERKKSERKDSKEEVMVKEEKIKDSEEMAVVTGNAVLSQDKEEELTSVGGEIKENERMEKGEVRDGKQVVKKRTIIDCEKREILSQGKEDQLSEENTQEMKKRKRVGAKKQRGVNEAKENENGSGSNEKLQEKEEMMNEGEGKKRRGTRMKMQKGMSEVKENKSYNDANEKLQGNEELAKEEEENSGEGKKRRRAITKRQKRVRVSKENEIDSNENKKIEEKEEIVSEEEENILEAKKRGTRIKRQKGVSELKESKFDTDANGKWQEKEEIVAEKEENFGDSKKKRKKKMKMQKGVSEAKETEIDSDANEELQGREVVMEEDLKSVEVKKRRWTRIKKREEVNVAKENEIDSESNEKLEEREEVVTEEEEISVELIEIKVKRTSKQKGVSSSKENETDSNPDKNLQEGEEMRTEEKENSGDGKKRKGVRMKKQKEVSEPKNNEIDGDVKEKLQKKEETMTEETNNKQRNAVRRRKNAAKKTFEVEARMKKQKEVSEPKHNEIDGDVKEKLQEKEDTVTEETSNKERNAVRRRKNAAKKTFEAEARMMKQKEVSEPKPNEIDGDVKEKLQEKEETVTEETSNKQRNAVRRRKNAAKKTFEAEVKINLEEKLQERENIMEDTNHRKKNAVRRRKNVTKNEREVEEGKSDRDEKVEEREEKLTEENNHRKNNTVRRRRNSAEKPEKVMKRNHDMGTRKVTVKSSEQESNKNNKESSNKVKVLCDVKSKQGSKKATVKSSEHENIGVNMDESSNVTTSCDAKTSDNRESKKRSSDCKSSIVWRDNTTVEMIHKAGNVSESGKTEVQTTRRGRSCKARALKAISEMLDESDDSLPRVSKRY